MKKLLAILGIGFAGICLADQTAIIVTKNISMQIDMSSQTTNTTYAYTFSVPQPVGQLQSSVTYSPNDASSETVSNDIAVQAAGLLTLAGASTNGLTVKMPQ